MSSGNRFLVLIAHLILLPSTVVLQAQKTPIPVRWQIKRETPGFYSIFVDLPTSKDRASCLELIKTQVVFEIEGLEKDQFSIESKVSGASVLVHVSTIAPFSNRQLQVLITNADSSLNFEFHPPKLDSIASNIIVNKLKTDSSIVQNTLFGIKLAATLASYLVLVHGFCQISGFDLLRFIHFFDMMSYLTLLNGKMSKDSLQEFSYLLSLTKKSFFFTEPSFNSSQVSNLYMQYRDSITDLRISPILIKNRLPESLMICITFFLGIFSVMAHRIDWCKKFKKAIENGELALVLIFLIEFLFHSSYQFVSKYDTKRFSYEEYFSRSFAWIFLFVIGRRTACIFWTGLTGKYFNSEMSRKNSPVHQISIKASRKRNDLGGNLVKEFVSSGMNRERLDKRVTQLYNPLSLLRLMLTCLSVLLFQNYTLIKIFFPFLLNVSMLMYTLLGGLFYGIFQNKLIAAQRIFMETAVSGLLISICLLNLNWEFSFMSYSSLETLILAHKVSLYSGILMEFLFFCYYFIRVIINIRNQILSKCSKKSNSVNPQKNKPKFRMKRKHLNENFEDQQIIEKLDVPPLYVNNAIQVQTERKALLTSSRSSMRFRIRSLAANNSILNNRVEDGVSALSSIEKKPNPTSQNSIKDSSISLIRTLKEDSSLSYIRNNRSNYPNRNKFQRKIETPSDPPVLSQVSKKPINSESGVKTNSQTALSKLTKSVLLDVSVNQELNSIQEVQDEKCSPEGKLNKGINRKFKKKSYFKNNFSSNNHLSKNRERFSSGSHFQKNEEGIRENLDEENEESKKIEKLSIPNKKLIVTKDPLHKMIRGTGKGGRKSPTQNYGDRVEETYKDPIKRATKLN